MLNFWLIARHEFRKMIGTHIFLATTIGVPLLIVVMIGIGVLANVLGRDDRSVGVVDQSGILDPGVVPANQDDLPTLIPYAKENDFRESFYNARGTTIFARLQLGDFSQARNARYSAHVREITLPIPRLRTAHAGPGAAAA
jgi:hypothetical protein